MNLALVCQGLVKWTKGVVTFQFKMDVVGCHVLEGANLVFLNTTNINFRKGITKCSNEVCNKFTDTRQHNKCLSENLGYIF